MRYKTSDFWQDVSKLSIWYINFGFWESYNFSQIRILITTINSRFRSKNSVFEQMFSCIGRELSTKLAKLQFYFSTDKLWGKKVSDEKPKLFNHFTNSRGKIFFEFRRGRARTFWQGRHKCVLKLQTNKSRKNNFIKTILTLLVFTEKIFMFLTKENRKCCQNEFYVSKRSIW